MTASTKKKIAGYVAGTVLLALYFAQSSTHGPNHSDGGVLINFIHFFANGDLPHHQRIDAYGPFNWVFPVLFYKLGGQHVWGVRIWMVILKLLIAWGAFALVKKLSTTFYALLALCWVGVLIGQMWQSLQTAYAFLNVMPWMLAAWYFLLVGPLSSTRKNMVAAGVFTFVAIWTKLNTGMFVLAGGLFYCFYWLPKPEDAEVAGGAALTRKLYRAAQILGLLGYAALFYRYIHQFFSLWYFAYLLLPLVAALGTAFRQWTRESADTVLASFRLRAWGTYLATSVGLSVLMLLGFYGPSGSRTYVRELTDIVSTINYVQPFPELGVQGLYYGLNEYFWLQMPWLLTFFYFVWLAFHRAGDRAFGERWPVRRAQAGGLFMLMTLYSFVMYSRADETHIFQTLPFVAPVLFVMMYQVERLLIPGGRTPTIGFRAITAVAVFAYSTTLAVKPRPLVFTSSDWYNPRLERLEYRPKNNPYVKDYSPDVTDHEWDHAADEAARFINAIADEEEEILVLSANRLLEYNSNTRPIGGRHFFYFYLVSVGLMDRAAFDAAVPKSVIKDILTKPPRIMVGTLGRVPLTEEFPELKWLQKRWYEKVGTFRHIIVYRLRIGGTYARFR